MRSVQFRPRPHPVPVRLVVSLFLAAIVTISGTLVASPTAHAGDADIVAIPDATLKAAINQAIASTTGTTRDPAQDVTVADARQVTTLTSFTGPVTDLTGMEALTNLTRLSLTQRGDEPCAALPSINCSTLSDLTPLAALTQLTILQVKFARVTDLAPLSGLTELEHLELTMNEVPSLSRLADLPNLRFLGLQYNLVRDISDFPMLPKMADLQLLDNKIRDVSPLVGKFDPAVLTTLNLSGNQITDASPLAPLGRNGASLGGQELTGQGLNLSENRIRDFSMFSDWASPPVGTRGDDQNVYVGPYRAGGIQVALRTAHDVVPTVTPDTAGSFDPATETLTITDPAAESVEVSPNWTVHFANPPVDPGDETGPALEVQEPYSTGYVPLESAPRVTQTLRVADPGAAFETTPCDPFRYEWLRDGEPITGTPYARVDAAGETTRRYGLPGDRVQYEVAAMDVGHLLSVRVTCPATGVSSTSTPTQVVAGEEADKPVVQDAESVTAYRGRAGEPSVYRLESRSGVVGDPTNPTIPVFLAQADIDGNLVDPSGLQVELTDITAVGSADTESVQVEDVEITGTGAVRRLAITPQKPTGGTVNLAFTVTGSTGKTTPFDVYYTASRETTPTSRVLMGSSDASTAIDVGDGHLLVADDEKWPIRLYDAERSGREVALFDVFGKLGSGSELDAESSARRGNKIWWLGSHANKKDGEGESSRLVVYETTLTGTGADAKLTASGAYEGNDGGLRTDLIEWDQTTQGGRLGFKAAGRPTALDGFNIEAAEFSPDDSALYLGFRSPVVPPEAGGKAVIVPVTNLAELTSGAADRARFADPILLDLGGDSIREIRKNDRDEYLILSAPAGPAHSDLPAQQTLWAWNGQPDTAPRRLATRLPLDVEPVNTDNAGAWEGIGAMPERLGPGTEVRLIMDQGYVNFGYGENKDVTDNYLNKTRTDVVTLAGPVGSQASLSDPGTFGYLDDGTLGEARDITLTNTGSNILEVGKVSTTDDDGDSANDFLITTNNCTSQVLAPTETCQIAVRFAPAREDTTSEARLAVAGDFPDGRVTVPLTGTTELAPLSTASPTITGTPQVGRILTAEPGVWSDGTELAYQWLRNGEAINGADEATYTLAEADADQDISVRVTGSKPAYAAASETSTAVTVARAALATARPTIHGTPTVGSVIFALSGDWTDGTTLTYQWLRNGNPIRDATSPLYSIGPADAGQRISIRATGAKVGYGTATTTSTAVRAAKVTSTTNTTVKYKKRKNKAVAKARVGADHGVEARGNVTFVLRRNGKKITIKTDVLNQREIAKVLFKIRQPGKYRVIVKYQGSNRVQKSKTYARFRVRR